MCNYDDAYAFSKKFDKQVRSKAESVSDEWGRHYADIIEASVRQCFAAYELTVCNGFHHVIACNNLADCVRRSLLTILQPNHGLS
jgi:hypothetical protein